MLSLQHKTLCTHLKPMAIGGSALYERIQANYNIIGARFEKEELLHLVSATPDIYLEEGGASSIIQNTGISTSQQVKVEIINNLLNRIMMYGTQDFSYQDSVYITSVLHKLGIQNVGFFMEQVKNLMNQENNSVTLEKLYQDNRELLTKLFREQEEQKKEHTVSGSAQENSAGDKSIYYLHQEVFKRLQTARIYEEVRSLAQNIYPQSVDVQAKEYLLSEHEKLSREYYRQELKNTVLGTDTPLLWHRVNVYEEGDEIIEEDNRTTAEERITSAVLLNLANNLYMIRRDMIDHNHQQWFDFHNALFMTSRDTIERVEAGLNQEKLIQEQNFRQENRTLLENQTHEKELLQSLVEHAGGEQIRQIQDRYFSRADRVLLEKEKNETLTYDQVSEVRELFQTVENQTQQKRTEIQKTREQSNRIEEQFHTEHEYTDNTEHTREQSMRYDHMDHEDHIHTYTDMVHREDEFHTQEVQTYGDTVRELLHTVENRTQQKQTEIQRIKEQTLHTDELLLAEHDHTEHSDLTRELLERMESHENTLVRQDGERTEAPKASQIFSRHESEPGIQNQIPEQAQPVTMENVVNEQANIENRQVNIENLEQELLRINEQNIANYNRVMEKVQQEKKQKTSPVRIDKKLAMQDGIRALEREPEEVIRTFLETPSEVTAPQEIEENTIYSALPPELKKVFRQIEEQGSTQMSQTVQNQRTQAAMNLLVRDIQEVSENRTQENVTRQEMERHESRQEELIHRLHENVTRQEAEITDRNERSYDRISLVHRKQEQQIDEELLESLREERTQNRQTIQNTQVIEQNRIMQEHQINTTTRNVTVEQHQDINELVREGVRKELGTISDKVYNQIERRLQSERKRRGY